MVAKDWIGPIILTLCSLPATAQQQIAATGPWSAAGLTSATASPVAALPVANSSLHNALPLDLRLSMLSGDWLTSPAISASLAASSRESSSAACTDVSPESVVETPGGGLAEQPLISRAMVREALTREHMVKMARDFVPGQPLPDAPSYTPMTSHEKFVGWAKHTYSADMFVGTAFDALILQASGAYPSYRGGVAGYGQRYATALLSAEASSLFGRWLFPTLLHQDPRYFPSKQTNAFDRMAYAVSRTVITRSDDGRNVFNSSLILTLLFSSALANGYKPNYDESFQATLANAAAGLGATAQMHLLDEFWPDLKRILLKAEPGKMKHLEQEATDRWQNFTSQPTSKKDNAN
jgi:hypothetical protein